MILAVGTTAAGFTHCSECAYKALCAARVDYTEFDTEVIPIHPTDAYRNAWQLSRPFSDTGISPVGWANAVEGVSLCAGCMQSAGAVAAGVLTTEGQAALE